MLAAAVRNTTTKHPESRFLIMLKVDLALHIHRQHVSPWPFLRVTAKYDYTALVPWESGVHMN